MVPIMSIMSYIMPFLLPPGLILALVIFCILIWWPKPFLSRFIAFMSMVFLYLFSTPMFAVYFATHFEKYPSLKLNSLPKDVERIVVIGPWNDVEKDSLAPLNGSAMSRIHFATVLHEKTQAPISIIVNEGSMNIEPKAVTAIKGLINQEKLKKPVEYINKVESNDSLDTKEVAEILKKKEIKNIILITESWHMPRAVMGFEEAGIRVDPAPTAFFSSRFKHRKVQAYLPNAEALAATSTLMHEAILYYFHRIKGMFGS